MHPPFFVDGNSLDYFETQLSGSAGNEVRVLILTAIERGDVSAPFPIQREYKEKNDPAVFILDPELKKIFQNSKTNKVAVEVGKLGRAHPKLLRRSQKTNRDPGDPWLVANAKVSNGTVISEECGSPSGIAGKQALALKKLPDVCACNGIPCTNGEGFLDWCRNNYLD